MSSKFSIAFKILVNYPRMRRTDRSFPRKLSACWKSSCVPDVLARLLEQRLRPAVKFGLSVALINPVVAKEQKASFSVVADERTNLLVFSRASLHKVVGYEPNTDGSAPWRFSHSLLLIVPTDSSESVIKRTKNKRAKLTIRIPPY